MGTDNPVEKPESPAHTVSISSFYLGKTEVTFEEYDKFTAATKRDTVPSGAWGRGKQPVFMVSWYDAIAYCNWLSDTEKLSKYYKVDSNKNVTILDTAKGYRLPTEAEWEYCCRAGTSTPFHFGSALNGKQANCNGNYPYGTTETGPCLGKTSPVGSYHPNAWGLYDMHGNVWERCQDWYGEYPKTLIKDPKGSSNGVLRVLRGGSWTSGAWYCRAGKRLPIAPGGLDNCGFRLLLPQ